MLRGPLAVWLITAVVAACFVEPASAQPPQGRRPGGPGGFGGGPGGGGALEGMLLQNEQVQKELELLPEQVTDLTKVRDEMREKMQGMFGGGGRDLPEEERRARFEEVRGKMEEVQKEVRGKINEVLLPHQQERLQQITLQLRGVAAISDPEVAEKLDLTADQKEKIDSTREEQREKAGAMFRQGGGEGDPDAMREKFQKLRQENEEQLLAILTTKQREQFETMKGDKFDIDMSQLGRGGFGGPGGTRFGGRRPDGERGERPEGERPEGRRPEGGDRPRSNDNDDN